MKRIVTPGSGADDMGAGMVEGCLRTAVIITASLFAIIIALWISC